MFCTFLVLVHDNGLHAQRLFDVNFLIDKILISLAMHINQMKFNVRHSFFKWLSVCTEYIPRLKRNQAVNAEKTPSAETILKY